MIDKLNRNTKAWQDRMERHKHNSFIGHATMMRQNCRSIIESNTATQDTITIARKIHELSSLLELSLREGRRE